ncbi:DUF1902 domain-containing protein [Paracoccus sp. SSK6]|uniref:DUF1902 domain-containing protein n=1 Tax=Paracoccus sp. SSK6 TaxID=3143131 RepID=UPI00321AF832
MISVEHQPINVTIGWDQDAGVWVATTADVPGLAVEADSLDKLHQKVMAALYDLAELNGFAREGDQIPVHMVTKEFLKPVRYA